MGVKKRGAPRQRKRANEAAEALASATLEARLNETVENIQDEELFVLDTAPRQNELSKKERQRLEDEQRHGKKNRKRELSAVDQLLVKKLIKNLKGDKDKIAQLAEEGRKKMGIDKPNRGSSFSDNGLINVRHDIDHDLWDEQTAQGLPSKNKANNKKVYKTIAVDLPQGGQSYCPDLEQHQNVIGEALALEVLRNEAIQYEKDPISKGMSEETLAILIDSDNENEEESDDENLEEKSFKPRKIKEKLTRAQRNKQKRHKKLLYELKRAREEKKLLNSLNEAKKVKKQLEQEEREKREKLESLKRIKEEEASRPLGANIHEALSKLNPIKVPALPVALTCELENSNGGSLRAIRPKGCLLEDRMSSFVLRKMANTKKVGGKKITQGKRRRKALKSF